MGKELLYLIGPYRAKTKFGILANVLRASEIAQYLWRTGNFTVICPHMNSAMILDGYVADTYILEGYRDIMCRCDAIAVMPGWRGSSGSVDEMKLAHSRGMKVYWVDGEGCIVGEGWENIRLPWA